MTPKALTAEKRAEKKLFKETIPRGKGYRNNEEVIKMNDEIGKIEQQGKQSMFVHGDQTGKSKLKYKSKRRGVCRFQDRDWVLLQKERRRQKGYGNVPVDSKYTE